MEEVRIDKYLWSIRVFKTRSEATDACKGGKIRLNGADTKPSKMVKVGDTIVARKGAVTYTYKVLDLIDKRQGPKLVPNYAENLTSPEELAKLRAPVETFFLKRDRGAGRPTKKDRRQMEALWDDLSFDVPDDIAESFAADFGLDDYVDLVCDVLRHLDASVAVERLLSQAPVRLLSSSPLGGIRPDEFRYRVVERLNSLGAVQGDKTDVLFGF